MVIAAATRCCTACAMAAVVADVVVINRSGIDTALFAIEGSSVIFGRDEDCDIRIRLTEVARLHTKLDVDDDKVRR